MTNPIYSLQSVKNAVRRMEANAFTYTALSSLHQMGLTVSGAIEVIENISEFMFYKTMKSEIFPDQFQDVYRVKVDFSEYYIKVSLGEMGKVVISFKEL